MSHLTYYDISSYQAGMSVKGLIVCIKATESTNYTNPYFKGWISSGAEYAFGYHFLHAGNAAAQAQHYYSVAGKTPCMIDCEPEGSSDPTVSDCVTFATELRRLGGVCNLVYYPKWYAGSQSLRSLSEAGLHLVSSDYTSYSDSGPGWASYGGVAPVVWQYTDAAEVNGKSVDANAYKGTLAQFKALVEGTTSGDEDMALSDDDVVKIWAYKHIVDGKNTEPTGSDVHQNIATTTADVMAMKSALASVQTAITAVESKISSLSQPSVDATALANALVGNSTFVNAVASAVVKAIGADLSK